MKIKKLILKLTLDNSIFINPQKLRGFFATKFNEYFLLHQHIEVDRYLYKYPLIQYKYINSKPTIIGINEGVDIISQIFNKFHELQIGGKRVPIIEKEIRLTESEFGISDTGQSYHFLTPWLALNQKNMKSYMSLPEAQKSLFLQKILIGNLLSVAKCFRYTVPTQIQVYHDLKQLQKPVRLKNLHLVGFRGSFYTNFNIPSYIGIGKGVSKGFGTVHQYKTSLNG